MRSARIEAGRARIEHDPELELGLEPIRRPAASRCSRP